MELKDRDIAEFVVFTSLCTMCKIFGEEFEDERDHEGRKVIAYKKNRLGRLLRMRTSYIEADNLIKMSIEKNGVPVPRALNITLVEPRIEKYIIDVYDSYAKKFNDTKVKESFLSSRLTGTSVDGVCNSLETLAQKDTFCRVDPDHLRRAIECLHMIKGWNKKVQRKVMDFSEDDIRKISYPTQRSGGILYREECQYEVENVVLRVGARGRKEGLFEEAVREFLEIVDYIRKCVEDNVPINRYKLLVQIRTLYAKIEALEPGVRKDKNRIFFIANVLSYIIQKYILRGPQKFGSGHGPHKVGISWSAGDMERLYTEFMFCIYIFLYDYSLYDHSHKATLMACIIASYLRYYKHDKKGCYSVLKQVLAFIIDEVTVRPVQWPDGFWRLVIGILTSGEEITTDINTDIHICLHILFVFYIMKARGSETVSCRIDGLNKPKRKVTLKEVCKHILKTLITAAQKDDSEEANAILANSLVVISVSGDNGMVGIVDEELVPIFGLKAFKEFSNLMGYVIKYENCNEVRQFHNDIDDDGELIKVDWIDPNGVLHKKNNGIEFLKMYAVRAFLDDRRRYVHFPFKPTSSYYFRPGKTATDLSNPVITLVRLHGLMRTTFVNKKAYIFLYNWKECFNEWFDKHLETGKGINPDDLLSDPKLKLEYDRIREHYYERGILAERYIDLTMQPNFHEMEQNLLNMTKGAIGETTFSRYNWFSRSTSLLFDGHRA